MDVELFEHKEKAQRCDIGIQWRMRARLQWCDMWIYRRDLHNFEVKINKLDQTTVNARST